MTQPGMTAQRLDELIARFPAARSSCQKPAVMQSPPPMTSASVPHSGGRYLVAVALPTSRD